MAPPAALPTADACLAAARAALQAAGAGDTGLLLLPPLLLAPVTLALAALLLLAVAYVIVDAVRYAAVPTIQVELTEGECAVVV